MRLESSRQIFEKASNIKFNENPPTGSPLFHADGLKDGQTGMMKLTIALPNFVNAPKMGEKIIVVC